MELTLLYRPRIGGRYIKADSVAASPVECHSLFMDVRGNREFALVFTACLAFYVMVECAFSEGAKAQESAETNQGGTASGQAASDQNNRSIESTNTTESEQNVKGADQSTNRPDPVFQEQTAPPPQPTLAEKKSPLHDQRQSEAAAKQTQSSQPPPEPVEEPRPAAPEVHYIWVPGFWYWYNFQYVWIPGRWIAPRPGYVFVRPRWARRAGVWVFLPGGWAIVGGSSIVDPIDIGIFVGPWLPHHRYYRYNRHFGRHSHRGRVFRPYRGPRPHARITTRRATQPRSRARHR